jgi:hypothetical protein
LSLMQLRYSCLSSLGLPVMDIGKLKI